MAIKIERCATITTIPLLSKPPEYKVGDTEIVLDL